MKKAKVSKYGQWKYPGEDTIIPNANGSITMKGVPYPVLGIDDQGNQQMMMPGGEYQFPGNSVYEIPMAKKGGAKKVKIKSLPKAQSGPNTTDPEKPYGSTKGIPSNPYQVINGQYVFTLPDNTTWSTSNRRQADSINAHLARGWGFTGERTTAGEPAWARIPKEVTDSKELTIEDAGTSNDPDVQKVIVNTPKGDVTKLQNLKTKKFIGYEVLGSPVNINNATGDPSVDFRKNFKAPIPLKPEDETLAAKDTNYRDGYYSFANMMGNKSPATLLPQHYAMYNEGIPYMNPDFKSALLQNRYSLPSGYSNDLQNQGYTFFPESGTWGIDINKQGPGEMGYKKFGGGLPKAQYGTQKDVERSWANSSHNSNMDIISRGNDTAPFLFGVNTDVIDVSNPNRWGWKNAPTPEPVTLDLNDPNYNRYKQWEAVYNLDQQYMPWLVNRLNDPSIPLSEKSHGPSWLPGSNYNDTESLNLNEIYDSRFLEEPYIKNNYDLSLLNDSYNYGDLMTENQYDFANEGLPIWAVTVDKDSTASDRKFNYLHQFFETPPPAIYLKGKDLKPTTTAPVDIQPQLQNMAPLADGSKVQRVTINTPQGDMVRVQDPKTKKFIRWENVSGEAVDFDDESVGDTSSDFPQIQKSKSRPSFAYGGSLPKAQTGVEAARQASNRLARRQQWLSRNPRNAYYTDIDEFTRANQAEEDSLNAALSTRWIDMMLDNDRRRPSSFHDPRSGINPNSPVNRFNPAPGRGSIANETIRPQRVRYETVVDSSNIPHTVRVNDYKWPETHAVYKEEIKPKMIEAKPFIIPQVDIQPQLGNIPELPIPKGSKKQRVVVNTPQGDMVRVQDPKTKKFIRWEHTSGESIDFEKKPTGNATDDFPEMRKIPTPSFSYGGIPRAQDGLPTDYESFLKYSETAPENRRPDSEWQYGNPRQYDHYGMWDALGKPENFNQALEKNPQWQPDPYDNMYHGFSTNPNTGVWLKSHIPGESHPGDTGWMEYKDFMLSNDRNWGGKNQNLVYDPDLQRMRYVDRKKAGGTIKQVKIKSLPKAQTNGNPNYKTSFDVGKSVAENIELNRRANAMGWNSVADYEKSGWGQNELALKQRALINNPEVQQMAQTAAELNPELANVQTRQDQVYADRREGLNKTIGQVAYTVSNPIEAAGHALKYGYVPQGNAGNYGHRGDGDAFSDTVNSFVNPFAWGNAALRLSSDITNKNSWTTGQGALNMGLDALEAIPFYGLVAKTASPALQTIARNPLIYGLHDLAASPRSYGPSYLQTLKDTGKSVITRTGEVKNIIRSPKLSMNDASLYDAAKSEQILKYIYDENFLRNSDAWDIKYWNRMHEAKPDLMPRSELIQRIANKIDYPVNLSNLGEMHGGFGTVVPTTHDPSKLIKFGVLHESEAKYPGIFGKLDEMGNATTDPYIGLPYKSHIFPDLELPIAHGKGPGSSVQILKKVPGSPLFKYTQDVDNLNFLKANITEESIQNTVNRLRYLQENNLGIDWQNPDNFLFDPATGEVGIVDIAAMPKSVLRPTIEGAGIRWFNSLGVDYGDIYEKAMGAVIGDASRAGMPIRPYKPQVQAVKNVMGPNYRYIDERSGYPEVWFKNPHTQQIWESALGPQKPRVKRGLMSELMYQLNKGVKKDGGTALPKGKKKQPGFQVLTDANGKYVFVKT